MDDREFIEQWRQLWRLLAPPQRRMRGRAGRVMLGQQTQPITETAAECGALTDHIEGGTPVGVPRPH